MYRKLYAAVLLLSLVMFAFAAPGIADASGDVEPKYGGTLRFGAFRAATTFDPHRAGGIHNAWLLGHVYDTLVVYTPDGDFDGGLAETWYEEDDRTYVFNLRQNAQFQDGTKLTADDVVATFERIQDPETAAALSGVFENVIETTAVDPYTVRVRLAEPDAVFLHALASYNAFILSAKDIENGFNFGGYVNGTGPFVLGDWEPERQYILERNPNYFIEELPYLDRVVITVITDDKARADALQTNQIDLAEYIPWQHALGLEFTHEVVTSYGSTSHIRINTHEAPFDDKRVRQALGYVIDRQQVLDLAFGSLGDTMTGPLQPEDSPFYVAEHENYYTQDWDKARALLQEAGYSDPAELGNLSFQVSVSSVSNEPAKVILQQMEEFGFKVTWTTVDVPTLQKNRREGSYQLHMDGGGMSWPDPAYLDQIFHSTRGHTHATGVRYYNERLDELLELGARTLDTEARQEIYREAEEVLLDDAPWVWVLWRPQAEVLGHYVKGYDRYPHAQWVFNVRQFANVWLDK